MRGTRPTALVLFALVGAMLAGLSCSNSSTTAPVGGATVHVRGTTLGFDPELVMINAGELVTFVFDEAGHRVVSSNVVGGLPGCVDNGMFDSGVRAVGTTYSVTFGAAGEFGFYCATGTHCSASFESGRIVVQ